MRFFQARGGHAGAAGVTHKYLIFSGVQPHSNGPAIHVLKSPEWNAMAMPNGSILVYTGLIEGLDDDEMAIVLGHEMAHVTHEHTMKRYCRGVLTDLVARLGMAGINRIRNEKARLGAEIAISLGNVAFCNKYSRDEEEQADRIGLRYAAEAGYNARKGPQLWRKFMERYGSSNEVANYLLGDHPTAQSRIEAMQREVQLNY